MVKFNYTSGNTLKPELIVDGDYNVMISKADVLNIQGTEKLVIEFTIENGEVRKEYVKPEMWVPLFADLLKASGQSFDDKGGEFDTDFLIGLEGILTIVKNEGKGKHSGRIFYNAEHFTLKDEKKSLK